MLPKTRTLSASWALDHVEMVECFQWAELPELTQESKVGDLVKVFAGTAIGLVTAISENRADVLVDGQMQSFFFGSPYDDIESSIYDIMSREIQKDIDKALIEQITKAFGET